MTDFNEILGEIWNFLWNHVEMTEFSEIFGEILKFLWNHDEMTDFNEQILKFLWNHDEMTDFNEIYGEIWKFLWNHDEIADFRRNLKFSLKWNFRLNLMMKTQRKLDALFFSGGAAGRHCPGCRFRCARRSRVRIVRLIASCRDLPPFSRGEQAFGAEKELCEGGGRRLANERWQAVHEDVGPLWCHSARTPVWANVLSCRVVSRRTALSGESMSVQNEVGVGDDMCIFIVASKREGKQNTGNKKRQWCPAAGLHEFGRRSGSRVPILCECHENESVSVSNLQAAKQEHRKRGRHSMPYLKSMLTKQVIGVFG